MLKVLVEFLPSGSEPSPGRKLNKMETVRKNIKSPEEIKICEPLGQWVESLLESVIQLHSKLMDMAL